MKKCRFEKIILLGILVFALFCSCNVKKDAVDNQIAVVPKSYANLVGDIPCPMPLTTSGEKLNIIAVPSSFGEDYNKIYVLNKYEEMTGVDVQWTTMPRSDRSNFIFDALTKGLEYDLVIRSRLSQVKLTSYGKSGLILDLAKDDLLKNNAPNCWAYLQSHPDTLASIMNPDGTIYSIPQVNSGPELRVSRKIFINKKWLDNVGMSIPTSTDELLELLKAFKEMDANGNGNKDDEIPFSPVDWASVQEAFYGAFGLANRGQLNLIVDSDPVRYIPSSPEYKKFLEYFNTLYEENLIDPYVFTSTDSAEVKSQWQYNIANDKIGVFAHTNLAEVPSSVADNWIAIEEALEGPDGYKIWSAVRANFHSTGAAFIPSAAKNPELALRWLDYFWTDEGTLFYHLGVEGETFYAKGDGTFDYISEIYEKVNKEGSSFDSVMLEYTPYPGGGNPTVEIAPYFMGGEMAEIPAEASRKLFEYRPTECWPSFTFTEDENESLSFFSSDINKLVNVSRNGFITGSKSFDEWDSYLKSLDELGVSKILEIYQKAVDRYHSLVQSN